MFVEPVPKTRLRGLDNARFLLERLTAGESESVIIHKMNDDKQLYKMWLNFVLHNHLIVRKMSEFLLDEWVLTPKGRQWLNGDRAT